MKQVIIGLTGKLGAGKDTVADYLVLKSGFKKYNCSDILRENLSKEKKELSIENLKALGNKLRLAHGHGVLAIKILQKTEKENIEKAVVVGLRHPEEVNVIKKAGGLIINIDSPIETRYFRIKKRGDERDKITFEEFKRQESEQLSGKGHDLNILKCIKLADRTLDNGDGLSYLYDQADKAVNDFSVTNI